MNNQVSRALALLTAGLIASTLAVAQTDPTPEPALPERHEHDMSDAEFIRMMIDHQSQGVALARLEEERGASPAVKALATRIRVSQESDIKELKAMQQRILSGTTKPSMHPDDEKALAEQGKAATDRMSTVNGAAADKVFLEEMVKHHKMTLAMLQRTDFRDDGLHKLAREIDAAMRQELAELQKAASAQTPA